MLSRSGLHEDDPRPGDPVREQQLRAALGIPADAKRVLLFAESSHWDTNWLSTSEEYFNTRVEPILDAVLRALEAEPLRVYCVESLFFLKLYWERRPDARAQLRELFRERRLRLLASSFTTPDTLLPHSETILRDFQLGHAWLREEGLPDAPGTAYFPDNFGHSPHLPTLMNAVGVHAIAITRIDGMYFVGADWRRKSRFPLPSSTAEQLEKVHASHDFVWHDDSGAEVLCHWNAHTYFQGDMLAHKGIIRWAGKTFALPWRSARHIAKRIDGYQKQLEPFARTPYLFCPIGMDFNDPIKGLPELLDRYNRERYPQTGTWALLAGLDDHLALVDCHRALLPRLKADPNPYWMGCLATRPEVKQRTTRIARTLVLAEKLSALRTVEPKLEQALREGWHTLVLSNHHDYIPGTSPDRVWHAEQKPWLDAAELASERALQLAQLTDAKRAPDLVSGAVEVSSEGQAIHLRTPHYRLTISRADGGCLSSFDAGQGELLSGLGFDLVAYHDEGGLWRLGHEYAGGTFHEHERASQRPAEVRVEREAGEVRVVIVSELCRERFVRTLFCRADEPFVRLRVEGIARPRTTVTCHFQITLSPEALVMDTVGGVIARPRERQYSPTFWAVPSRLTLDDGRTLHALFECPTAASMSPSGALEWIVARNALKERAFGWLPVLAHPIGGSNSDLQVHEAALMGKGQLEQARRQLEAAWLPEAHRNALKTAEGMVHCDAPHVTVSAVKRSHHGGGVTVRLFCEQPPVEPVRVWLEGRAVRRAYSCDALEREHHDLVVDDRGRVVVQLASRVTSLGLLSSAPSTPHVFSTPLGSVTVAPNPQRSGK